jgi:hypothetical protein
MSRADFLEEFKRNLDESGHSFGRVVDFPLLALIQ